MKAMMKYAITIRMGRQMLKPKQHFSPDVKGGSPVPMITLHLGHECTNFLNPFMQRTKRPGKGNKSNRNTHPNVLMLLSTWVPISAWQWLHFKKAEASPKPPEIKMQFILFYNGFMTQLTYQVGSLVAAQQPHG